LFFGKKYPPPDNVMVAGSWFYSNCFR